MPFRYGLKVLTIRGRIPLSERPASSLPISGKKPVAFSMHSDVRASRTALCASVMSGYITRLSSAEKPSLTSPLPRARIAQTRGPGFGPDTPSRDLGSPPVLGNRTVHDRRPRLGFLTDDKTRIDPTLFLTCWLRAVHDLRECETLARRHLSGGESNNHQLVEPHKA